MPLNNVSPDVLEFVDTYIDCFVSWDIIAYFHENPDTERKVSSVALDIGRRVSTIERSIKVLVEQGILAGEAEIDDEPAYRYSAPADFRNRVDKFLAATRDRTTRLAIVSKVLQKEARKL